LPSLAVEAGRLQCSLEPIPVRLDERHAGGFELLADGVHPAPDVLAFIERSLVEVAFQDCPQVLWQILHRSPVGKGEVAVPDMAGRAAELLHLEQLAGLDGNQVVFLPIDNLGAE
jgi:hypothetical protein